MVDRDSLHSRLGSKYASSINYCKQIPRRQVTDSLYLEAVTESYKVTD